MKAKTAIALALICGGLLAGAAPSSAQPRTFFNPTYAGFRLDWCLRFAEDCGRPAADMFCRTQGYSQALSFAIDHNIGVPNYRRTRIIGTSLLCNASYCDGFRFITCS